jgi:uroporphyrinogen decarboxylase
MSNMDPKERVYTALHHMEPDRVPMYASFVPEAAEKLRSYFNIHDMDELLLELGNDMVMVAHGFAAGYYARDTEEYNDEWGCKWKYFSNSSGRYPEIVQRPLSDKSLNSSYSIPDPIRDFSKNHSKIWKRKLDLRLYRAYDL